MNNANRRLVILTQGGGRFCNQLIIYGHLIAFVNEYRDKYDLMNMSFFSYRSLLEDPKLFDDYCFKSKQLVLINLVHSIYRKIEFLPAKIIKLIKAILIFLWSFLCYKNLFEMQSVIVNEKTMILDGYGYRIEKLCLDDKHDIGILERSKITLLSGWKIRSWHLFHKHQDYIREKLKFNQEYQQKANIFIQPILNKYDFVIGVSIRQGDYRKYKNGQFYFTTEQYVKWMMQTKKVFSSKGKIGFVVTSDETKTISKFQGLDVHFASGIFGSSGHYVESILELSKCHLIMTPPSTFGLWSAFIGRVPVLPLYDASQYICENNINILDNNIFDAIKDHSLSYVLK